MEQGLRYRIVVIDFIGRSSEIDSRETLIGALISRDRRRHDRNHFTNVGVLVWDFEAPSRGWLDWEDLDLPIDGQIHGTVGTARRRAA